MNWPKVAQMARHVYRKSTMQISYSIADSDLQLMISTITMMMPNSSTSMLMAFSRTLLPALRLSVSVLNTKNPQIFFLSIHYHIPVFFNLSTTIYELRNYMCYSLFLKRYQKNEIIDIIFARLEELKMSNCALLSLFTVLENLQIRNYYEMI